MKKWPLSLGQRDRAKQYESYVKPLSPEDKIILTQQAHKQAQKDLNKVLKLLEQAINHYSESHYGSSKAIELLAKARRDILNLKERVKKETFNALPYKELKDAEIDEKEFMDPKVSLKTKLLISLTGINLILYGYGWFIDKNVFAMAIMYSLVFFGALFAFWGHKTRKMLRPSHRVGG